ncbi:MAG: hypothetical protein P8X58_09930 [Syntrophobacterales bacterium]
MAPESKEKGGAGESLGKAGTKVKDGIVGSLKGIQEIETEIVNVTRQTNLVKGAVRGASEVGGDVALVARSAVSGVMEAAGQAGSNVGSATKAAVTGAMEAASSLSQTAITGVRDVLVTAVGGLKDVVAAMMPKGERPSGTGAEATPEKKAPKSKSE